MLPVKEYTFENFITGKSNQFAFMAAKAVAEAPGETYNPLILYGESGLGKTHLLNAIYNHIHESTPAFSIFMVTADELTLEMISAIKAKQADAWRQNILSFDVLLIDDAHILADKKSTQIEFAHLIRDCVGKKHRVVMTASIEPEKLPFLESSLRSDYERCLIADIQPLDMETCRLVARYKTTRCGLSLSDEMLEHIASHANGEVHRLDGIISRLRAEEELMGSIVDSALVKQICEDYDRAFSKAEEPRQKTVFIMMGIQGSGKSEFCRRFLPDIERISLDELKTRNNEKRLIAAYHTRGIDYVVDNTNPTKDDRARYIPEAKAMGYRVVGYFMQSRLKDCIARNNLREGKEVIPAKAIAMTSNILEMPSKTEGFDELYFVANDGAEMTVSDWRENDEL